MVGEAVHPSGGAVAVHVDHPLMHRVVGGVQVRGAVQHHCDDRIPADRDRRAATTGHGGRPDEFGVDGEQGSQRGPVTGVDRHRVSAGQIRKVVHSLQYPVSDRVAGAGVH